MEETVWRVRCRFPDCDWVKSGKGGFVVIDDLLMKHVLQNHTHRELVEVLVSSWLSKATTGLGDSPMEAITAGEGQLLQESVDLCKELARKNELIDQLKAKLGAREEKQAAPYGKPMHEYAEEAIVALGGKADTDAIKEHVAAKVAAFLVSTARINAGMTRLLVLGRCERGDFATWQLKKSAPAAT